jgi:hypothetical protein
MNLVGSEERGWNLMKKQILFLPPKHLEEIRFNLIFGVSAKIYLMNLKFKSTM